LRGALRNLTIKLNILRLIYAFQDKELLLNKFLFIMLLTKCLTIISLILKSLF